MHNQRVYYNNAKTTLASAVAPTDITINVANGALFSPVPTTGQSFTATIDSGSNIEVILVGGVSGNQFINCTRGYENTTASAFQAGVKIENRATGGTFGSFARLVDRLAPIQSVDNLASPALSDGNSYVTANTDDGGNPVIAVTGDSVKWRFIGYPTVVTSGSLTSVGTSTTITLANASTLVPAAFSGTYIIQFITGQNAGLARAITAVSGTTITWTTALPNIPQSSDSFEIYQSEVSNLNNLNSSSDDALIFSIILGS